jgi:hypothetical protein
MYSGRTSLDPNLNEMNPVHVVIAPLYRTHFNSIFPSMLYPPSVSVLLHYSNILGEYHACYMHSPQHLARFAFIVW